MKVNSQIKGGLLPPFLRKEQNENKQNGYFAENKGVF